MQGEGATARVAQAVGKAENRGKAAPRPPS